MDIGKQIGDIIQLFSKTCSEVQQLLEQDGAQRLLVAASFYVCAVSSNLYCFCFAGFRCNQSIILGVHLLANCQNYVICLLWQPRNV